MTGKVAHRVREKRQLSPLSSVSLTPCRTLYLHLLIKFGRQEPGTNEEIAAFARGKGLSGAGVQVFAKVDVKGGSAHEASFCDCLYASCLARTTARLFFSLHRPSSFFIPFLRLCSPFNLLLLLFLLSSAPSLE